MQAASVTAAAAAAMTYGGVGHAERIQHVVHLCFNIASFQLHMLPCGYDEPQAGRALKIAHKSAQHVRLSQSIRKPP